MAVMSEETPGGMSVFYDAGNVMSYGMARLKADLLNVGLSEQKLKAMLAEDGDHHQYIVEGFAWWRSVPATPKDWLNCRPRPAASLPPSWNGSADG
jgi:hypothetical protein